MANNRTGGKQNVTLNKNELIFHSIGEKQNGIIIVNKDNDNLT